MKNSKVLFEKCIYLRIELGPNVVDATDWSISLRLSGSLQIGGP